MAILFIERGFRLVLFDRQSASWVVPSFAPRLRGVRLILRALASSSHICRVPSSSARPRQTSVVFCEARAFLVRSSLIYRNSQLASSAMIQGLCVVFCGLGYAWSKRLPKRVIAGSARSVSVEGPGLTSLCLWRNAMIILTYRSLQLHFLYYASAVHNLVKIFNVPHLQCTHLHYNQYTQRLGTVFYIYTVTY